MFVKIGSGIFNNEDIRAVLFEGEELTVYLKNIGDSEEEPHTVDKDPSDNSSIEKVVSALNAREVRNVAS